MAALQKSLEQEQGIESEDTDAAIQIPSPSTREGQGEGAAPQPQSQTGPSLITATKQLQGDISLDEVSGIREEIIRNLTDDGGEVTVTITVSASKAGGFSQNAVRAVRENGDALQLELQIDESPSREANYR